MFSPILLLPIGSVIIEIDLPAVPRCMHSQSSRCEYVTLTAWIIDLQEVSQMTNGTAGNSLDAAATAGWIIGRCRQPKCPEAACVEGNVRHWYFFVSFRTKTIFFARLCSNALSETSLPFYLIDRSQLYVRLYIQVVQHLLSLSRRKKRGKYYNHGLLRRSKDILCQRPEGNKYVNLGLDAPSPTYMGLSSIIGACRTRILSGSNESNKRCPPDES